MAIESNPEILGGKPVVKGTRIPVDLILELAGLGYSIEDIVKEYPALSKETVMEVLRFAKRIHESASYEKIKKLVVQA